MAISKSRFMLQGLLLALGLLTRIPIPLQQLPSNIDASLKTVSAIFYPVVGAIIGCLLCVFLLLLLQFFPASFSPLVQAALVLFLWVMVTGAIHLDGLADAVDAAFASHKSPERALAVFRDPSAGPMAVVAVVLLLIMKLAMIESLLIYDNDSDSYYSCIAIVAASTLSRLNGLIFMANTPYARQDGLAANIILDAYQKIIIIFVLLSFTLLWLLTHFFTSLLIILMLGAWALYWRSFWLKKINGYTGDCVGALIEVSELITLFICLWLVPSTSGL
ncbi:adenosylcobinamide-GDP ribazoletransferase [Agarilytica rhodophyticola]|uniref:adenosylcobinamide-GDP ribazoletransferase n=1 Tax=Agarilytica rhodophyticola TaxID=1737490 RepID=UPI000B3499D0|nr:adenosylcobinamide-GDP ribazoletransferase [Agarilytica rhodophyticola]